MERRSFLQFLGLASVGLTLTDNILALSPTQIATIPTLAPSLEDKLLTAEGLNYDILIRWGEVINANEKFGFNNDFIAFHPLEKNKAILWVNHEYVNPIFVSGPERTKINVDLERKEVGGSILGITNNNGKWIIDKNSKYNRRIDGTTEIPFAWKEEIAGSHKAIGTMANCAGGKTPWGSFLTCEENYDMFWGERKRNLARTSSTYKWEEFYPYPPEHYGWVVEVDPLTGRSKKLISLGRCAHECAAVTRAKNGKIVVYTGDDANDEHFYKFISNTNDSLDSGKIHVASLEKGEWISLDINDQPILKKNFKNQTEIQIHIREAAKLVGATALARPEDIEFDPLTKDVLVALTNNKPKKNYHGSILKITEKDSDPGSLHFSYETFLTGGPQTGFSCPDNLVFDKAGNLWFTTDMAGDAINKDPYKGFGNNGLFVFIRSGTHAGKIIRVANAPTDAEFTGPCFSPDYKTLFLSVQHPGELSINKNKLTSTWPDGEIPRPCVVTLRGPLLDKIVKGEI